MFTNSLARKVPSASTSYANSFFAGCVVMTATERPPLAFAPAAGAADLSPANRYHAQPISKSAARVTMTRPLRVTYSVSLPPAAGGSGSKRKEKYLTTALPNVGGRGIRAAGAREVSREISGGAPASRSEARSGSRYSTRRGGRRAVKNR